LRQARIKAGFGSRPAAEKATGISAFSLKAYEDGKNKPSVDALRCLAAHYSVSTDWLLGLSDSPAVLPTGMVLVDAARAKAILEAETEQQAARLLDWGTPPLVTLALEIQPGSRTMSVSETQELAERVLGHLKSRWPKLVSRWHKSLRVGEFD
jgi:hypothetical protein